MNSFLVLLYQPIVISILSEWIEDVDLCVLDSALCNKKQREGFLVALTKMSVFNTLLSKIDLEEQMDWYSLRGMGVKNLQLQVVDYKSPIFLSFLSKARQLSKLVTPDCTELNHWLNRGIFVKHLKLTCASYLLSGQYFSNILHLDVSRCDYFPDCFFSMVALHCSNLKVLTASYHGNISPVFSLPNLESIHNCNLAQVFANNVPNEVLSNYTLCRGDLKRVSDKKDVTAICIGENNVFHMISLHFNSIDRNVWNLLTPFLVNLTTFSTRELTEPSTALLQCFNLTSIDVGWSDFSANCISLLKQSSNLTTLKLSKCFHTRLSSVVMTILIDHCPKLESLMINSKLLKEIYLMSLFDRCKNLRVVEAEKAIVTDAMVNHLGADLASMVLQHGTLSVVKIGNVRGGKQLSVQGKHITGDFNFPRVFIKNPLLTSVDFSELPQLTDYKLRQLVNHCPLLSRIRIHDCPKVTIIGLQHLTQCAQLTSLYLYYQHGLSDSFIHDLLVDKPNFTKLTLPDCSGFRGELLMTHIVTYCPFIRSVDFSYNNTITSSDVITLLDDCSRLDTLVLKYCPLINSEILPHLRLKMRYVSLTATSISKRELNEHVKATGFHCSYMLDLYDARPNYL